MSLENGQEGLWGGSEQRKQIPKGRTFQAEQNFKGTGGWDTLGMLRKKRVASVSKKAMCDGRSFRVQVGGKFWSRSWMILKKMLRNPDLQKDCEQANKASVLCSIRITKLNYLCIFCISLISVLILYFKLFASSTLPNTVMMLWDWLKWILIIEH